MRRWILLLWAGALHAQSVTPLVTGNGFGFALVPLQANAVSKFYVHPYKFTAPNHADPYGDGLQTANLLKSLGWSADGAMTAIDYFQESQVIQTQTALSKYFYYMPFGFEHPAVVLSRLAGGDECLVANWAHPVASSQVVTVGARKALWVRFNEISDSALVVPLGSGETQLTSECFKGSADWIVIGVETSAQVAPALREAVMWQKKNSAGLLAAELTALENWRVPAPTDLSVNELKLWRQSETILRMAQSREPNRPGRYNHGLIVASLPEGGWFMPWVRDMSYATLGWIRMGHRDESRWAVESMFNARPIGRVKNMVRGFSYQIPVVRYFGDGSEETNFGGENAPNVEFDNWGNALNILSEYVERFGDHSILEETSTHGTVYVTARDYIVKPLLGNLDPQGDGLIVAKDTSVWEANAGSEQHFSYSTAAAIQGFRGFAKLAGHMGDFKTRKSLDVSIVRLEKGFKSAFVQGGFIHGTLEDNYVYNIDSAVLEPINFGIVHDTTVIGATLAMMENLKMPSGGYRRIRGNRQYDKQEFVFSDINWARNYLRLGQAAKGASLMQTVVDRSMADHGFIPEMYVSEVNDEYPGAIGAPAGSIPMVGYGAGMWIIYLMERSEPRYSTDPFSRQLSAPPRGISL